MKQQVVFIHGGEVFDSYDAYITMLASWTVDPFEEKKRWRMTLSEALGEGYEVIAPQMPNKLNAKYREWEIWFDKFVPFLRDDVVLIGHSLGASFFLKYLSQRSLPISVRALYLVAAPYFDMQAEEGGDFRFKTEEVQSIQDKAEEVVLAHSSDDPVVLFSDLEKFKRIFTGARTMEFTDRGHFNQESFPELIEDVKRPK